MKDQCLDISAALRVHNSGEAIRILMIVVSSIAVHGRLGAQKLPVDNVKLTWLQRTLHMIGTRLVPHGGDQQEPGATKVHVPSIRMCIGWCLQLPRTFTFYLSLLLLHFLKSVILHAAIKFYIQYLASSA